MSKPKKTNLMPKISDEHEFPCYRYNGALKKAVGIAEFYGFRLIPPIEVSRKDHVVFGGQRFPRKKVAVERVYIENGMERWRQPVRLAYTEKIPRKRALRLTLEVLGLDESVAEALIIHTAFVILGEHGHKNICVNINSMGDNDAIAKFNKELTAYFRKNLSELDAKGRNIFKKDVFELLNTDPEKYRELKEDAPKPINFLGHSCRRHFSEVLEYLEALSIPYKIDGSLTGNKNYSSRTIFEIRNYEDGDLEEDGIVVAGGQRYDSLSKRAGFRKKIPAISTSIDFPCTHTSQKILPVKKRAVAPKIFLVQLGADARQRALNVAEQLRRAHVPANLAIEIDGLSGQLLQAKKVGAPLVAILGQKEISEDTIIVRSLKTLSQETVPIGNFTSYVKSARNL